MSSLPLAPVVLAAVLIVMVGVASSVGYLLQLVSTHPRSLDVNVLVRAVRAVRSRLLRGLLALPSAPHLVEVLLRLNTPQVAPTPRTAVGSYGPAVLWRYGGTGSPVLVVHSVVTRPWVLDLAPNCSLVRALQDAGHAVYLLDWGVPGSQQARAGLQAYAQVLLWAEDQVRAQQPGQPVHLVGYCAGGTLALATHAALGPRGLASMTLIAAPVDTAAAGGMGRLLSSPYLPVVLALDERGLVPGALLRESFHALRPTALRTVRTAVERRRDPQARAYGGALGRWAWDQTPLPGRMLLDLAALFRRNLLIRSELTLFERRCDLSRLQALPLLTVTTVRDHIVPPASTTALSGIPGLQVTHLQCRGGHISMLAGPEAHAVLYPGLTDWLRAQPTPHLPLHTWEPTAV